MTRGFIVLIGPQFVVEKPKSGVTLSPGFDQLGSGPYVSESIGYNRRSLPNLSRKLITMNCNVANPTIVLTGIIAARPGCTRAIATANLVDSSLAIDSTTGLAKTVT
jgi:hypothetical protein